MIYERTTLDGKRFAYDSETGLIYWWARKAGAWKQTGKSSRNQGRLCMGFGGRVDYVHRVVWWVVYGEMPKEIDHINHDFTDNRLSNLRNVERADNAKNRPLNRTNVSGVNGVHWVSRNQKWCASIYIDGKQRSLGYFASFDEAVKARRDAEAKHGFHPNHGQPRTVRAEIHPTDSGSLGGDGSDEPHNQTHQLMN
jgi:hypothetical protein